MSAVGASNLDAEEQFMLAKCHANGDGFPKSPAKAAICYTNGASLGHLPSLRP